MNIQARKLSLIEKFLHITDESVIEEIEVMLELKITDEVDLKPMTLPEFFDMIDQAKKEKEAGLVVSHKELLKEMNLWK